MGLGVLSQVRDGEEHPVTYLSRKLLAHERNYSTVEKEALAIKWAITKLSYYLLGHDFLLVTDHAPLKWMATAKDSNARVTRWFLALQAFRFRVEHRPGREHANADALSRRDACGGWTPRTQGLRLRGGICGNPAPPRPLLGRVENGVYRRWPAAGDNRPLQSAGNQAMHRLHRLCMASQCTDIVRARESSLQLNLNELVSKDVPLS